MNKDKLNYHLNCNLNGYLIFLSHYVVVPCFVLYDLCYNTISEVIF